MPALRVLARPGKQGIRRWVWGWKMSDTHYVYVLLCADGSLYAGYTVDVHRRLAQHQAGKAARYTRSRRPVELVARWSYPDRATALRAERAFKQLDREAKLATVADTVSGDGHHASAVDAKPRDRG